MPYLLDTSVAIPLRDGDPTTINRLQSYTSAISILTHVELEGGVYGSPKFAVERRTGLDILLAGVVVIPFGPLELAAYRTIIEAIGYSRPKVIDRMIAATALVHDLTLVTCNGRDFRDVPGLRLEAWPTIG